MDSSNKRSTAAQKKQLRSRGIVSVFSNLTILCALSTISLGASAQEPRDWDYLPGQATAGLVEDGWRLITSSGLSWPDGSQAVITYWNAPAGTNETMVRCVTYYDQDMRFNGDSCRYAGYGMPGVQR